MPKKSDYNPAVHSIYRLARVNADQTLAKVSKGMKITTGHLNDIEHGRRRMTPSMQTKWEAAISKLAERKGAK